MLITVREANEDDIETCAGLLNALFSQDLEFQPDRNLQVRGLKEIISNPAVGRILVAVLDNKVIGMVSLLFSISTVLGGKVATLEDMIVDESYRKIGIGKQLFQKTLEYSRDLGCLRITLLTDHDNATAIGFYESFGFSKSPMIPLRRVF